MYCLTHWWNKCGLDQVRAHNYIFFQSPTQQAIQCLCQIYACCRRTGAKWLDKNCWDSRVKLYCFCALHLSNFFICCSQLKSPTYHLELQPEAFHSLHQIAHTKSTNYCSSASTDMATFGEKRYLVLRHIQSLFIETINKGQLQSVLTVPLVLLMSTTGKRSENKSGDRIQAAVWK